MFTTPLNTNFVHRRNSIAQNTFRTNRLIIVLGRHDRYAVLGLVTGLVGGAIGLALLTAAAKPKCPACGKVVKKGEPVCASCGVWLTWK